MAPGTLVKWPSWIYRKTTETEQREYSSEKNKRAGQHHGSSLGILNDKYVDEVPGSVLLLSKFSAHNEPLGLQYAPGRTSSSSLPQLTPTASRSRSRKPPQRPPLKRSSSGEIILEPQPDDSLNDPLNWSVHRRDAALLSLGLYCLMGGGMTTILAAGFNNVATTYGVTFQQVAHTTGLYMMGLGIGGVFTSPTAILFGKRPVYLVAAVCFVASSVWCALSPSYASLVVARVFQGLAVSPVEVLPSASIAEIYFLHERAFRLGIYTLLLLGGKNLVPLVSAAVIQGLGWRWVFWVVAIIVGFCMVLLFFFVPETFWDRSPRRIKTQPTRDTAEEPQQGLTRSSTIPKTLADGQADNAGDVNLTDSDSRGRQRDQRSVQPPIKDNASARTGGSDPQVKHIDFALPAPRGRDLEAGVATPGESQEGHSRSSSRASKEELGYTEFYRLAPPKSYLESLNPWSGRLSHDNWLQVAIRPFILFAYPAVLWSALVYALSVGWLIVLSESVAVVYRNKDSYNFDAMQTGIVYLSPFIGGILGTAVAGKLSDVMVRFMAKYNNGVYEPEFRLVMGIPIAITSIIGLMGFGWSAQERDNFMVPTVFFGIISFGCTLGSTTSITFCVDSYRQYAGEALVTLNFSKNIFHGLVFSFFFTSWLESDGPKVVFIAIGAVQLACLLFTIPLYIYGKRARMWTVRQNMMERFRI